MTNDYHSKMTFATGAQRSDDTAKSRIDLISPIFLDRLGHHLGIACTPINKGGKGYAPRNWENGVPISRYVAGVYRHLNAIQDGKTDEDHEAALAFAIMGMIHTREMIRRGKLPPELDDLSYLFLQGPVVAPDLDTFGTILKEIHKPADPLDGPEHQGREQILRSIMKSDERIVYCEGGWSVIEKTPKDLEPLRIFVAAPLTEGLKFLPTSKEANTN